MGDSSACPVFLCYIILILIDYVFFYMIFYMYILDYICFIVMVAVVLSGAQWCSSYSRHSRSE